MTKPLDQSDLVPGRHDKLAAAALQRMIEAHQRGLQLEAAQEALQINLDDLDPEQVAQFQAVTQRIAQLDRQAAAIIARLDNYQPRDGTARSRVTAARAARGNTGIPRSWKLIGGGAIGGLLLLFVVIFFLGRATGGGSSEVAPEPTKAPAIQPTAPAGGAAIQSTGAYSQTGSVLLTGDMRLKVKANGAEAEITPATMQSGEFSLGGQVIGMISLDEATGGKRLNYNGSVPVTLTLYKVDPSLAPVSFTMGSRAFTVLAQTDGKFHLVTLGDGGKDWGTFAPPEPIDIGATRITTADAGDSIEITFPAKPAVEPAPTAPAGNG